MSNILDELDRLERLLNPVGGKALIDKVREMKAALEEIAILGESIFTADIARRALGKE